jgi:hypothetical protein
MVYRRSVNRGASALGARGPLEQQLEFATLDPVTFRDEADQGIVAQLGQRAPGVFITSLPGAVMGHAGLFTSQRVRTAYQLRLSAPQ